MDDRCKFFDSNTYYDYGIKKRENLKANSPGRSGSFTGSRASFSKRTFTLQVLQQLKVLQPPADFVAEPTEIPIFKVPEAAYRRQRDSYKTAAKEPQFFNST